MIKSKTRFKNVLVPPLVQLSLMFLLPAVGMAQGQAEPGWTRVSLDSAYDFLVTKQGMERIRGRLGQPDIIRVTSARHLVRNVTAERLSIVMERDKNRVKVDGYDRYLYSVDIFEFRCEQRRFSLAGTRDYDENRNVLNESRFDREWTPVPNSQETKALRAIMDWACRNAPGEALASR